MADSSTSNRSLREQLNALRLVRKEQLQERIDRLKARIQKFQDRNKK